MSFLIINNNLYIVLIIPVNILILLKLINQYINMDKLITHPMQQEVENIHSSLLTAIKMILIYIHSLILFIMLIKLIMILKFYLFKLIMLSLLNEWSIYIYLIFFI